MMRKYNIVLGFFSVSSIFLKCALHGPCRCLFKLSIHSTVCFILITFLYWCKQGCSAWFQWELHKMFMNTSNHSFPPQGVAALDWHCTISLALYMLQHLELIGTSFLVVEMNGLMYSWTFCAVPIEIKLSTPICTNTKKVISIKQTVLWIDSFNWHIHGPCRAHF